MFNKRKSSPENLARPEHSPVTGTYRVAPSPPAVDPTGRSVGDAQLRTVPIAVLPSADKPSIVSQGLTITGDLRSNGVLHVEGRVSGNLTAESINISVTGEVQGEVTCISLNIKGQMLGTAVCDELVVASSAHVQGSISYKFLSIGSGATIEGDLHHLAS